jgi:hypothetical protein
MVILHSLIELRIRSHAWETNEENACENLTAANILVWKYVCMTIRYVRNVSIN